MHFTSEYLQRKHDLTWLDSPMLDRTIC